MSQETIINSTPPPKLYIPEGGVTLDKAPFDPQIRLGIQGFGGSGKTFVALTFPNPVVMNLDKGLGAHYGRADVVDVKFGDPNLIDKLVPRANKQDQPYFKEAITKWLDTEAKKLSPEQTLVEDSTSQMERYYHSWYAKNKDMFRGTSGRNNSRAEWGEKIKYFDEIFELNKQLSCDVVTLVHEMNDRDDTGSISGLRILITGSVADRIVKEYTDWFRCISVAKPKSDMEKSNFLAKYCDGKQATMDEFVKSTPAEYHAIHILQTQGDDFFKAKCSSFLNLPKFVVANYNSLSKYRRKQTTASV